MNSSVDVMAECRECETSKGIRASMLKTDSVDTLRDLQWQLRELCSGCERRAI
jgi:uncharacterized protein YjaG (DUF416 family)